MKNNLISIVTGGQTGVDRAIMDFCLLKGIPLGGWCPKGRLAEDGIIDSKYPLIETQSSEYEIRTDLNVKDSDGTLILNFGEISHGTLFTLDCAKKRNKPYLIIESQHPIDVQAFNDWLHSSKITILNVAGPRESLEPGKIYTESFAIFESLFSL